MPQPINKNLLFISEAAHLWQETQQLDIGYVARVFTQTSLPYKDPGSVPAWGRRNGDLSLVIQPGMTVDPQTGTPVSIGFPFGVVPRLLLTWLSTEAVRTRKRELFLGENLSDFMRQLGLSPTGGKTGSISRLRRQMERLFLATITVRYSSADDEIAREAGAKMGVATAYDLWWNLKASPNQTGLFSSYVCLSDEFYQEVISRPIPVSVEALRVLRGPALRLDIYSWLTYRMSYLRRRTEIPWDALRFQFGSQYANDRSGRHKFRSDFEAHLKKVLMVYEARVESTKTSLVLHPSRTHISKTTKKIELPGYTSD